MHLFYLDDSGSAENPSEDYLVLGGISVFEPQVHYMIQRLDELAEGIMPSKPHEVEFHASEIFSRRIEPWSRMTRDEATGVIKAVLKILAESYDSAKAFACAIHKKSFVGTDPMQLAFEDLCSRFDRYLESIRSEGDRQRGMIIFDKSIHETTLQSLSREFRIKGTKWGRIRNIADVPFFVDSRASRVIQLADHVSYAVYRRYQQHDAQYFDIIAPKFYTQDGVVHGLAHKQKIDSSCRCLACFTRR